MEEAKKTPQTLLLEKMKASFLGYSDTLNLEGV
jgi:hypothetical protein